MVKGRAGVKVTDKTAAMDKFMGDIRRLEVFVGIPEEESSRPSDGVITNAELAYIHTHGIRARSMRAEMQPELDTGTPYSAAYQMYIQAHGSPLWQSPPRPIIEPAIEYEPHKKAIAEELGKAAKLALSGDLAGAKKQLEVTGMLGQNIARGWFTNPANGWPPNAPATIKAKGSDRPLIGETGHLRMSITYVVGEK